MEAILFYGDQDEATRRQVRSVAAQYSHRIGPRKRKIAKVAQKPAVERKRGQKKVAAASNDGAHEPESSTSPQSHQAPSECFSPRHTPHLEQSELHTIASTIQNGQPQWNRPLSSEVTSEPSGSPHTPQLGSLHSAPEVSNSPKSPVTTRLPEYTWTEYPRYAINRTGSMSPQHAPPSVPVLNRRAFQLPDPTALQGAHGHPQLCQYETPRSQPVEERSPQHTGDLRREHSLSRTLQRTSIDEHEPQLDMGFISQVTPQPRLTILRCTADENGSEGTSRDDTGDAEAAGNLSDLPP